MPKTPKEVTYSQNDLIAKILGDSVESRASDIHIDPTKTELIIRFRIDGILHSVEKMGANLAEELVSRIKVLAQMNITERRHPQDGHFEFNHGDSVMNVRVATYPTIHGEAVAMRILNDEAMLLPLKTLGLEEDQFEALDTLIKSPFGMIFVTGPTGSGKSTLLYSILNTYDRIKNNIITVEDPVELSMNGMRQLQINESLDLTFANAMRSVLRQDPDILMVGEVRDSDTAEMAFQAALTGRLVYSTFHTFDLPSLVTRFHELGVPFTVISQGILGVVSKRLVRTVCKNCAQEYEPTDTEQAILGDKKVKSAVKGAGCDSCMLSGYQGRTGIFEVVPFDDDLRSYILEKRPAAEIKELLSNKGIKTMKNAAVEKLKRGETTLEEIGRVLGV